MNNLQEKLTCSVCGGSFFTVARAEQFQSGGYGSAEFRSLSNAPKTVLNCIGCSTPVSPKPAHYGRGTTADIAEQDFRKSIDAGQKYRKDNSIQNVANVAASITELQEVRATVEDIKKHIEASERAKAPKPKATAKAKTVGG